MAGTTEQKDRTAKHRRLAEADRGAARWRRFGPYLSERQWGTVREDYSGDGNAWFNFPHDHARSRAYRWGEDGIAGISDDQQRLCLALALWNERDPFLKERLFGLTGPEGNHGEDVKEYYYYLDATPTHSYLKMLYKYPQGEYPYAELRNRNPSGDKLAPEFELIDTGLFDEDRYFDVFVEYAKAAPDDILMVVTVHNRGPDAAPLHVLPTLWFRNTWSWKDGAPKPSIARLDGVGLEAKHEKLGTFRLYCDGGPELLFCENETNFRELYGSNQAQGYFKDGINNFVVERDASAVNPQGVGSKAAPHYRMSVPAGGAAAVRLRLTNTQFANPFGEAGAILARARKGADDFYADLQRELADPDARLVQRQALAGMIWTKQFYYYDVLEWLNGDPTQPAPPDARRRGRNSDWSHVNTADVLSMPDKWEYPWFAAWDLAFHCLPLALIDPEFAKEQLVLLTREWYSHPNGQLPAYEWNFGDVNPPVHAWATWRVFQIDRKRRGDAGDTRFLERVFHKLLLNFTWWVNRKDVEGRNIFQGGFLGLDNIGVFDRSRPLPTGGHINQADGTSWMAMYCLNMMRIALELARHDDVYEDIATKFFEHFLRIAEAMTDFQGCGTGLWDEEDKFYYDMLRTDEGGAYRMRLRSMVGLIPLFAVEVLEPDLLEALPGFHRRLKWFLNYRPDLAALVSRWEEPGVGRRRLLSLLRGHRMKRLLARVLDESEFLSDYGVRALSKMHKANPFRFDCGGEQHVVAYLPGESDSYMFGGNSNWRGPIWMPVNFLLIESMQRFHHYYGDDFKIECPAGSGRYVTILEASEDLTRRLTRIFMRDGDGRRAVFGNVEKFQTDPHFRDYVLFHEYFHGDTGRGVGASHQTGWTGLIAKLMQPRQRPGKAET
jgi:Mannosylglycerate hydrolase MGH1-like glycoside hydrolase domain/Glycosyl hydrolase family 63 C-terminal domain